MGLTKGKKGFTFLLLAAEYVRPSVVNATPQVQSRQHWDKISGGHGNGDGYGDGYGDVTGFWNWMLELRWTEDGTGDGTQDGYGAGCWKQDCVPGLRIQTCSCCVIRH